MDNQRIDVYNYFRTQIKWIDECEIDIKYLKIMFHDFCEHNNFPYIIDDIS